MTINQAAGGQPWRDRPAGVPDLPGPRHRDRRGALRRRRRAAVRRARPTDAVRLPGNAPAETYLRGELLVDAARRAGADAVHPGYGFLSESAELRPGGARRRADLGRPDAGVHGADGHQGRGQEAHGGGRRARARPSWRPRRSPRRTCRCSSRRARAAAAGGCASCGALAALAAVVEQASNEAASAFGDPTVFCEPYVERGRHIEVQVVGDAHGAGARPRRARLLGAAAPPEGGRGGAGSRDLRRAPRGAARRCPDGRRGDPLRRRRDGGVPRTTGDRFFFLEMNTRLQVEHPVTECVTGRRPRGAAGRGGRGRAAGAPHAPAAAGTRSRCGSTPRTLPHDWQPQSGRVGRLEVPGVVARFEQPAAGRHPPRLRVRGGLRGRHPLRRDAGEGHRLGADARRGALRRLAACPPPREDPRAGDQPRPAGRRAQLRGVPRRGPEHRLPRRGRRCPAWTALPTATEHGWPSSLLPWRSPRRPARSRSGAAAGAGRAGATSSPRRRSRGSTSTAPRSRCGWYGGRDGYRLASLDGEVRTTCARASVEDAGESWRVVVEHAGRPPAVRGDDRRRPRRRRLGRRSCQPDKNAAVRRPGGRRWPRDRCSRRCRGRSSRCTPATGDQVTAGQPVLVLEAMKMQHTIAAPHDGVVAERPVGVGDQVAAGAVLAVVVPPETPPPRAAHESGETP